MNLAQFYVLFWFSGFPKQKTTCQNHKIPNVLYVFLKQFEVYYNVLHVWLNYFEVFYDVACLEQLKKISLEDHVDIAREAIWVISNVTSKGSPL